MAETLREKRQRAGKDGGNACMKKYGREFFVVNGHRGGRPKSLTLNELQRQQALQQEKQNKEKEERYPSCKSDLASKANNLRELKRRYAELRKRSTEEAKIREGEALVGASVSPGGGYIEI